MVVLGYGALSAATVQAEGPLRWKLKAGEALRHQMKQDMNMKMDAGPAGKLTTTAVQTMDMSWNVKNVTENGDVIIEQNIDRIRVKMAAPGGQGFEYDSESEEPAVGVAAMVAPVFEAMTLGSFEFKMSPRGEISDVQVSKELIEAIKNAPGGDTGGEDKAIEQFKSMVSQVAFVLPEEAPQPGKQWTTKIAVVNPAAGNQSVETTYTFEGFREVDGITYAVIKPSMKMELAGNPMMDMKIKEQTTSGEVLFNVASGRLGSMEIDQAITLDIIAAGQTMPGTIDQKIEVQVTPIEASLDASAEEPAAAAAN